jgi:hypothetical protein
MKGRTTARQNAKAIMLVREASPSRKAGPLLAVADTAR